MRDVDSIQKIAALSFADHIMEQGPAKSWRLGKPGTGHYSFRVAWAPGVLSVSGDIGEGIYRVWPSFATPWGAVDFVSMAGFDYLCEKSAFQKEFDREATVSHLLEIAYGELRYGSRTRLFDQLCDEYGGDPAVASGRKDAARSFRDDGDLTAERVYDITGDFESPSYGHTASARWAFEALKLWAKTMEAQEPWWRRAWRRARREYGMLHGELRSKKHFRPDLHVAAQPFNGNKFWVRLTWVRDGEEHVRMAAVIPVRILGVGLSRLGLWREQGSSWPLSGDSRDALFRPLGSEACTS